MNRYLLLFFVQIFMPGAVFCEDQVEAVRRAELDRNYRYCMSGSSFCNKQLLTTNQTEDARKAELDRNYRYCMSGSSFCNKQLLTTNQTEDARKAELDRNYRYCMSGSSFCNKQLLTTNQTEDARKAELDRNYRYCMSGSSFCNKQLLTTNQIEDARKAELDRNYRYCMSGSSLCNKTLLGGNQGDRIENSENKTPKNEQETFILQEREKLAEDRRKLEEERRQQEQQATSDRERQRQQLAEERRRLEEEKRQREQEKANSQLNLQVSATKPTANGAYTISIQTNADTASLKINGEELGGRADGVYVLNRVARAGQDTKLDIVATDIYNNSDTKTITVTRPALPASAQTAILKPENIKIAPARDAVAIIIGIQDYKRVPKAEFANNDAKEFYEYAIRALGIKQEKIKMLLDDEADEVNIVKAFENWLPIQVDKDKTDVYVFYSGHGLPAPDGKSLYFLPHGVDKELLSRTAISQNEIVAALSTAKPKSVTMFIDACYSGQTRGGDVLVANAKPVSLKSDTNAYPPNFTVITASTNDQISSSSQELKHGIFSFYLMKGMEGEADANKDGKITLGEMQDYLSDKVSRQAMTLNRRQTTQLVGDTGRVLVGR